MKRPFGITLLAIVSGFFAILAAFAALRFLGIGIGPARIPGAYWYAFMYALLAWVYIWLAQMLLGMHPSAWMFLAIITVFNLIMNFMVLIGSGTWYDVNVAVILNGLVLIYIMLPGTKKAFGMEKAAGA